MLVRKVVAFVAYLWDNTIRLGREAFWMKKLLAMLLILLLMLALAGCNQQDTTESPDGNIQGSVGDGAADGTGDGQTSGNQNTNHGGYGTGVDLWELDATGGAQAFAMFKKDVFGHPDDGPWCFWNDGQQMLERWIRNETTGELLVTRMKKTAAWEEITADLPLKWTTLEDVADRELVGKTGTGRLETPAWFLQNIGIEMQADYAVTGGIWHDAVDGMTYAMLALGDGAVLRDPYRTFTASSHASLEFTSYAEALEFLKLHNYRGDETRPIFARVEEDGTQTILQMDASGSIYCRAGTETDFTETIYDTDNQIRIQRNKYVTEGANRVEYTYENDILVQKLTFDANRNLLENYGYNVEDGSTHRSTYKDGREVYSYSDTKTATTENWYEDDTRTVKRYQKFEKITVTMKYKALQEGEYSNWYILSREGDWGYTKFTYVSEDSPYLIGFEDYRTKFDEKVVWVLNGTACNDSMDYVVSLERTVKGVTKFYTRDQIPWGTGMTYPPHFQHELNN